MSAPSVGPLPGTPGTALQPGARVGGMRMPGSTPTMSPRLVAPLDSAVPAWLKSAQAWIRAGDPAAADALANRPEDASTPRAVIIGETNRGKSSLVNAILGTPDLSPVDAGVATATYLLFRYGEKGRAVVKFGPGFPASVAIPVNRISQWATHVEGEGDPDLPPPRWIEVSLPTEVLRRARPDRHSRRRRPGRRARRTRGGGGRIGRGVAVRGGRVRAADRRGTGVSGRRG